ncbi:TrkA family potassium uptake protein [Chitinimonas sp.]|uniref:potassium channel family protein n=1 Tax=Chitinimonas sp. TaxID=1934313 RepID=UPI0035B1E0C7
MDSITRKLLQLTLLVSLTLAAGTLGYVWVEGWSWFDGLYMTVITLATIGYGEVNPLDTPGRVFTMLLILFGSAMLVYAASSIASLIIEGQLVRAIRRRAMQKSIDRLSRHHIVCGHGSTGRYVVEGMQRVHQAFVVIEQDAARVQALRDRGLLVVEGDATQDEVLARAGIARAAGLVACLHHDADNVFVVLTARELNADLRIVAKAVDESAQRKLRAVGADGVVLPNFIGGVRMLMELVQPNAITLLDMMLRSPEQTIIAEEIALPHDSRWLGQALATLQLEAHPGASLLALQRAGSAPYQFNPPADTILCAGDVLIVMGEQQAVQGFSARLRQ